MFAKTRLLTMVGILALSSTAFAGIYEDLQKMTAGGQCIEQAVADMVAANKGKNAGAIVSAAYALIAAEGIGEGCTGNVGQAAIAAGADPNEVLAAAADSTSGGGPEGSLIGIGGGSVGGGGGGFISPS